MPQDLSQIQSTTQSQALLPSQVALVKLLELPVADFEERVRKEMLENTAIEEKERDDDPGTGEALAGEDDDGAGERSRTEEELDNYRSVDEVPDYLLARAAAADSLHEPVVTNSVSLYDSLRQQAGEHDLSPREQQLTDYLIGTLDDDGFLRKDLAVLADELAVYHNVVTDADELLRLLSVLQTFEPRGIGARNLQECMRLQLTDPDNRSPWRKPALEVVDRYFKDFAGKRWDNVMRRLGMGREDFDHVIHELTHLNPAPGRGMGEGSEPAVPTVVPDFFVTVDADGRVSIDLNNGDVPELCVSRAYLDTIKTYSATRRSLDRKRKDEYTYAKEKVDAARSFISLIERRRQTLLAVMQAIVDLQRPFFDEDDELLLRPMVLKDVAARAGVDVSTVSRVTGSKYVQTVYGVYPLKFFFSTQFTAETGEDLSARQIKSALRAVIAAEDKSAPLADELLAARLKEQGFPVARRTVAKYREQMGIPVARLRKS